MEGGHIFGDSRVLELSLAPDTFPHLHYGVPLVPQELDFGLGGAIGILHGAVQQPRMSFLALWMTAGTAVPIASVELVDGVGGVVITIDGIVGARDAKLALVSGMLERSAQLRFLPLQPLHGRLGVIGAGTPSLQGFGGDGLFCHPVHAEISIT